MLRRRSPQMYRAFLQKWRDLHDRGAAERLAAADDAALRRRIERMILDVPALSDLHESARAYLAERGGDHGAGMLDRPPLGEPGSRRAGR